MDEYLTSKQFAELHDVSETTVRQWIRRGKIRSAVKIGNIWKIPADCRKPERGFVPCEYYINHLSDEILCKFPLLESATKVGIDYSDDKTSFIIKINNRNWYAYSNEERERLELALIAEPGITEIKEKGRLIKKSNINDAVIFIRFHSKYDDCDDDVGVAISIDAANKYVENLRREYPDAYGERYGKFIFITYHLIK